jgi:hypothetical protein
MKLKISINKVRKRQENKNKKKKENLFAFEIIFDNYIHLHELITDAVQIAYGSGIF